MAWQLTAGLQNLRGQVNARWPNRDRASDGSIGDAAHQASTSGHNPDDTAGSTPAWNGDPDTLPEVRSWDADSDLREEGTTAQMLVDHMRKLPALSSVIRYMIYNRKMYHSRDGFEPTDYSGASAHTEHIHFEGAWTQAGDNNTTFDFKLEEVGDVALTSDEIKAIARAVWGFDPGKDASGSTWPGVSDATYNPDASSNGTVAPGTALSSLLSRQKAYGEAQGRVVIDVPALAAALAPLLNSVDEAQIANALRTVLHNA